MTTFTYPAKFERGDDPSIIVATFPDIPEAITEGTGWVDARAMAADALGLALLAYLRAGRPLPKPSRRRGTEMIAVEPEIAAKIALVLAFAESGLTQRDFSRRLGKDEKEIRRMLDPMHPTKLSNLSDALKALGHRLVITVEKLPDEAA
jgi:antitoxin HicB